MPNSGVQKLFKEKEKINMQHAGQSSSSYFKQPKRQCSVFYQLGRDFSEANRRHLRKCTHVLAPKKAHQHTFWLQHGTFTIFLAAERALLHVYGFEEDTVV